MNRCVRESMSHYQKSLDEFLKFAGRFEYFAIEWLEPKIHYKVVKGATRTKDSDLGARRAVALALQHDVSGLLFFDLWRELGQAVRSLLSCIYESVPRSLRWMIEATVFWAEMQLDASSAHDQFQWYYEQRDKINKKEYRRVWDQIHYTSSARFEERLLFREKYRRPGLGEVLNNLRFSKVKAEGDLDPTKIKKTLRTLYSEFSQYSHVTLETVHELYYGYLHGDFAFYQDYSFDQQASDRSLLNLWNTVDNLLALIILTEAEFLGYGTPKAFIQAVTGRTPTAELVDKKKLGTLVPLLSTMMG